MAGHVPPTHKTHAAQFLNQLVGMTSHGPGSLGSYVQLPRANAGQPSLKHQAAPDLSRFARPKSCGKKTPRKKQATKRFGLEQAILYIYGSVILPDTFCLLHFFLVPGT